jgi:hypothetical protein
MLGDVLHVEFARGGHRHHHHNLQLETFKVFFQYIPNQPELAIPKSHAELKSATSPLSAGSCSLSMCGTSSQVSRKLHKIAIITSYANQVVFTYPVKTNSVVQ